MMQQNTGTYILSVERLLVQILVEADEKGLYLRSKHTNTVSLSS